MSAKSGLQPGSNRYPTAFQVSVHTLCLLKTVINYRPVARISGLNISNKGSHERRAREFLG